jgi:cell division protein FtsA
MSGVRLEAKVHIVTGADSAAQNIVKCVQRCGLVVEDIVLEQLASSFAVLTDDEKELGVCIVDIGGGTTDIAVFSQRRDPPHRGDPDRRRPGHQRHRGVDAHADAVRRGHQDPLRLRALAARQSRREHRSAQRRRPAGAPPGAPDAGRDRRAALRGAVQPDPRGAAPQRLRGSDRRRHRADRRQRARWKARSSWPRRSFTCRCASACRRQVKGLSDVVRNPIYSTGVGCCCTRRENAAPGTRSRALGGVGGALGRMKSWFQGNF